VATEWATASYFLLLGVQPVLGRFYDETEDRIDAPLPVVVLGFGFWQRQFGGDAGVLGRRLNIGKGTYTVIGVAPRGFTGVDLAPVDAWLPMHAAAGIEQGKEWVSARSWYWFAAVVRLDPTVPSETALAEATTRYRGGRAQSPRSDPNARIMTWPLIQARGPNGSGESRVTQLLGMVALLVLLIACANVANLFLARGLQRRRAFAVQSALGVSQRRLVLQLLAEATLLSVTAALLSVGFARLVGPAFFRIMLPGSAPPETGGVRLLLFTAALAAVTVILAGLAPALRAARVDPFEALRTARASARSSWLRSTLLALQAALSVVLLVGAGLFLRSLDRARNVSLGVDLDAIAFALELTDGT
jgi:hypothetical protein